MRQLVEVRWFDSLAPGGDWSNLERMVGRLREQPLECRTVGILLEQTDDRVIVAQTVGMEDEDGELCDAILVIPRCSIVGLTYLGVATQVGTTSD